MAPSHDHLANARNYIAIAESSDSRREAYTQAADAIIAWLAEDKRRSQQQAADGVGISRRWLREIVSWRTNGRATALPGTRAAREARGLASPDDYATRKTLRERPEAVPVELLGEALAAHAAEEPEAVREAGREAIHATLPLMAPHKRSQRHPQPGVLETAIKAVVRLTLVVQKLRREEGPRDAMEDARLLEQFDRAEQLIDWARAFVREGSTGWDDAFAELVQEMEAEREAGS